MRRPPRYRCPRGPRTTRRRMVGRYTYTVTAPLPPPGHTSCPQQEYPARRFPPVPEAHSELATAEDSPAPPHLSTPGAPTLAAPPPGRYSVASIPQGGGTVPTPAGGWRGWVVVPGGSMAVHGGGWARGATLRRRRQCLGVSRFAPRSGPTERKSRRRDRGLEPSPCRLSAQGERRRAHVSELGGEAGHAASV